MKELAIEEKAKRYDEAIKMAKSKIKNDKDHVLYEDDVIEIFPELKESEDERTWIINYLKNEKLNSSIIAEKENLKKAIAWLEKQGEQKPADKVESKFKVGDIIKPKDRGHEPWQIMQVDMLDKKYRFKDGYVIHFSQEDNYELVKQNPAWSEYDENGFGDTLWAIQQARTIAKDENDMGNLWYAERWLKSIKGRIQPKQEWSEDDTEMLDYIISYIEVDKNNDTIRTKRTEVLEGMTEWLKSLKDMCIQQPEQKWSDDDAGFCARIQGILNVCKSHKLLSPDLCKEMCDWLKSLRPQNHWKPSKEQLEALQTSIGIVGELTPTASLLKEIREQLKKLRE